MHPVLPSPKREKSERFGIKGLASLSLCDWPGKSAATLFLGGCSLACPGCHNAQIAWRPWTLPTLDRNAVFETLRRRRDWLDGIVVCGGEPTETPWLLDLLSDLALLDRPLKLDTNGLRPDVVKAALDAGLVHTVAVDLKGPFALYPTLVGAVSTLEAEHAFAHIFDLARFHKGRFHFRTTVVPGLSAAALAEVRRLVPAGSAYSTQPFIPPRKPHAQPDMQTGRSTRNVVHGTHRRSDPESALGLRGQGSPLGQASGFAG